MKIFNKIVWSKKEPINKNDMWFDGSTLRVYTEGSWEKLNKGFIPEVGSRIILDIEKLGEPIESDGEGVNMRYSKEQFENAIGMSLFEFFEKIKTSELVLLNGSVSISPYYIVADEYAWTGYYSVPGFYNYVITVDAEGSKEKIFVTVYNMTAELPFATTEYVNEKHAQTEAKLAELLARIEQLEGKN